VFVPGKAFLASSNVCEQG